MTQETTTRIDLLRHGQPENDGCLSGQTDALLTAKGWQQMRQAMSAPENYDLVVSSPLKRCAEFADEFSQQQKLPLEIIPCFQEMSFGDWDGMSYQFIHQNFPEALQNFWSDPWNCKPPRAESIQAFIQRITQAWQQLLSDHQEKRILLVTHSGVIRQVIAYILAMDVKAGHAMSRLAIDHASLTGFEVYLDEDGQSWPRMLFMNRRNYSIE
ncbi:histidine phosphatase family protein [Endozoicomonas sp. OPT23]|uniref:histidine phosphatase family protein n=1 Tax=Endozoicomonas sp. OPT23 TaxID=2072845 RepID=UPI00129AA1FD|nr:histidine phosphatase family protein [Endozoicomonas sp. OPT23]MRI31931.1 histidine phosphatase family protein [Endozoicomonas sp. OPT23]